MAFHSRKRFESWLPALFDGEFQWDFLRPAWKGTKIEPMDFDAVVERNGHFLIFETKIPGKAIAFGQSKTLTEQWARGATVFLVSGKTPESINGLAEYVEGAYKRNEMVGGSRGSDGQFCGMKQLPEADAYDVLYRARCWFCWANGKPAPERMSWDNELWVWDYDGRPR